MRPVGGARPAWHGPSTRRRVQGRPKDRRGTTRSGRPELVDRRLLARWVLLAAVLAGTAGAAPAAESPAPAPESVIGFVPCSDHKLATYEQIAEYFRRLAGVSPRIRVVEIGATAEGRTQVMAIISSEANLQNLDHHKHISRRLALARDLTDADAQLLAREGRAVVWIDFGLHSTEVAHGQTAPLLAHRAVTDESAEMDFIRDNVIFLLVPSMNPDGTTLVADWYMRHVGTPYELSSPPVLYHKYAGHDNNRDWFMFNLAESRNVARQLYQEWFPQIVYNQHQTAPFPARIFVPPFDDPVNPNIPPLVIRGVNLVGSAMSRRLEQEGKTGAISRLQFDAWWNGGMRTAPYYHNMIGILSETAHASATPATYDARTFPKAFSNGIPTLEPSTYYPVPYRGGRWHLRDSCDYMITASMAVLDIGARRREEWLYDIYQMGRDAIRAGASESYVVPPDQWDPGAAARLIDVLRWGGIEVARALDPFTAGGREYPAGSYVISGAQPFRAHLTDLLNPQVYPDLRLYPGGPPKRPYDITGWTLPIQMGVSVDRIAEAVQTRLEPVEQAPRPAGAVAGRAKGAYAIDPRVNAAFTAVNRLLRAGDRVHRSPRTMAVGNHEWPAGTFLVSPGPGTHERLEQAAASLGLPISTLEELPAADLLQLQPPRVGLYGAWGGNMDEGWTRWLLEQFEFPFTTLRDADIRAGNLRAAYDVIILPQASHDAMLKGLAPGTMPAEYTGGLTPRGVGNLYAFVSGGGTLVAMDAATELPITAFGLQVRNVTVNQPEDTFFIPGTLVRIAVDPEHPLAFGMPAQAAAFFARSPAFAAGRPRTPMEDQFGREPAPAPDLTIAARYPERDLLLSGWLLGETVIAGRAAVVEAAVEKGRVVLLGFRTQHRGQPHGTFKLLFNAIYLASSTPPAAETALVRSDGG